MFVTTRKYYCNFDAIDKLATVSNFSETIWKTFQSEPYHRD